MDADVSESRIHDFLRGVGRDGAGRSIETVLRFDDAQLDGFHDYIQWLFPLPEPSRAVPESPVLSPTDVTAIRADSDALRNLGRATDVMAGFYARNDHWVVPHDHNHLRITRILRCLGLLRGPAQAQAFLDGITARVASGGPTVSPQSRAFWADAISSASRPSA